MRAVLLRRLGFLTVLACGLVLCASALLGVSRMDSSLRLATTRSDAPHFVGHEWPPGACPEHERRYV